MRPLHLSVSHSVIQSVRLSAALLVALSVLSPSTSRVWAEDRIDFNRDIRPILSNNCLRCHGPDDARREADLRLDTFQGATFDNGSGPAVVPHSILQSALVQRIESADHDERMPPADSQLALTDQQIDLLKRWIKQGAEYQAHWAFQPPRPQAVPTLSRQDWSHSPIDQYVLQELDHHSIAPAPAASRQALLRRIGLDLVGLPPTVDEVRTFAVDNAPDALDRRIDRWLASPRYGERWGRHWLDQARYADSHGYTVDSNRSIWPFRDWVINAINDDLPFDQFTIDQLAGDLLPNPSADQKIATGFHRNTLVNQEGGTDPEQFRNEAVVDRVNTTGAVWLGLTVGCAQCHNHKYDPLSHREFYQLFAFFNSDEDVNSVTPTLMLPSTEQVLESQRIDAEIKVAEASLKEATSASEPVQADVQRLEQSVKEWKDRKKELQTQIPSTMVMHRLPKSRESFIHVRGDFLRHGEPVVADVPAAVPPVLVNAADGATRLDLAGWLVSPENPIVARVIVNRSWTHFFSIGLVETENDFGIQGTPPSHPALLDYLALQLRDHGWSMKRIHRQIVSSATYQQSSQHRAELQEVDPSNKLLARQSRLRLDAEIVRDSGLQVSGLIDTTLGGPSVYPPQPDGVYAFTQNKAAWPTSQGGERYRRGIYTFFRRSAPYPMLTTFDTPRFDTTCTLRMRSNTPLQSLTMANDAAMLEMAAALGQRIWESEEDTAGRIGYAFELCFARQPTDQEFGRTLHYWQSQSETYCDDPTSAQALLALLAQPENGRVAAVRDTKVIGQLAAWIAVARVLMNLDEFVTRE